MESPYTVTSLSKSLNLENGKIQAAVVHSFRGLKKRKRHEVTVGVDGESLNIYNIQAQSLIASYAIPPQTYLCCAPCSIYVRKSSAGPAHRYTYAALSEGRGGANCRVVRFIESLGESASFAAPVKSEVKLRGSPFALEALPTSAEPSEQAPTLLVSYANGDVQCVGVDHARVQWSHSSDKKSPMQIEVAAAVDSDTAKRGLLKSRDDVLAALGTSNASSSIQLYRVARNKKELSLQIFHLRTSALQQVGGAISGMDLLDTVELTSSKDAQSDGVCDINAASGLIYRLSNGRLTVWNLMDSIPRLQTTVGDAASDPIKSFVRTSPAHVLTATSQKTRLYDVKFGSVQATGVRRLVHDATSGKKRKRESEVKNETPSYFVSSFSDLGLAVGIDGHELVAFNLARDSGNAKRARVNEPLLIDAIGKSQRADAFFSCPKLSGKEWEDWTSKVDELVKQNDVDALNEFVDRDLKIKYRDPNEESASNGINGSAVSEAPWTLDPEAYDPSHMNKQKAMYILGAIFALEGDSKASATERLSLQIRSRNLIQWLAMSDLLNEQHLSTALKADIQPGSIAKAIGLADDTFQILQDLVTFPIFLSASEVTSALALLIESLDTRSSDLSLLALPSSTQVDDEDAGTTLGNTADSTFESESRAAEKELTHAISALQTGLDIRSQCLRLVFARLRALPTTEVRAAFRQQLSHRNLVFFIQMLRVELAEGGWTSRYIDVGNDEYANRIGASSEDRQHDSSRGPSDQALRHIGQLLTCAIDAIGMNGWLVGLSGDAELTQEILDSIRAEVSASLEGCLEAQTLERFLGELEKYADDLPPMAKGKRKGKDLAATELPLGCRYETARRGKGGRRSVLEIARERDARVGKYSVDRIRV